MSQTPQTCLCKFFQIGQNLQLSVRYFRRKSTCVMILLSLECIFKGKLGIYCHKFIKFSCFFVILCTNEVILYDLRCFVEHFG